MSAPHTGKLKAIVNGIDCRFDGNEWTTADTELTMRLNDATDSSPKMHFTIYELAEHVLRKSGLFAASRILSAESDRWDSTIPEDSED